MLGVDITGDDQEKREDPAEAKQQEKEAKVDDLEERQAWERDLPTTETTMNISGQVF